MVKDKTMVVEVPPVTVTETPEKEAIIMTIPSETVVSDPSSRETQTSVETTRPVEEASNIQPSETSISAPKVKNTASRVLASTGANVVSLVLLAGVLVGVGVFVTRRKK